MRFFAPLERHEKEHCGDDLAAGRTRKLDVGFGDIVVPAAMLTTYPTILDLPAPHLLAYSKETAVAEKFEAMVKLGELNSRMKDFFDIWLLSRSFDFDGPNPARGDREDFRAKEVPPCLSGNLWL